MRQEDVQPEPCVIAPGKLGIAEDENRFYFMHRMHRESALFTGVKYQFILRLHILYTLRKDTSVNLLKDSFFPRTS